MLHGLFGSSDNWLGVAPKLADHFHLFLLDLRNHGQSPHSEEMDYPVMAADIAEWMDAQKLDSANVLGHSMGGKVAMQLALDFPERIKKLVVVDIAPRANPPEHNTIFAALLGLDLNKFQSLREIEEALAPEIPDLVLRRFLLKNLARLPKSGDASVGSPVFKWKINLPGIYKNYSKICDTVTTAAPFIKPSLFLRGERSHYVTDADSELIRELFPAATIEILSSAGHWVHASAPEEFMRCVSQFLIPGLTD